MWSFLCSLTDMSWDIDWTVLVVALNSLFHWSCSWIRQCDTESRRRRGFKYKHDSPVNLIVTMWRSLRQGGVKQANCVWMLEQGKHRLLTPRCDATIIQKMSRTNAVVLLQKCIRGRAAQIFMAGTHSRWQNSYEELNALDDEYRTSKETFAQCLPHSLMTPCLKLG